MLAGCATPYQPFSTTGGYSERRIDRNTFLVWFSANVYRKREVRNAYFFHRCAEVTRSNGFDYFVIQNYEDFKIIATHAGGGGVEAYIKLFRGRMPSDMPAAYDARTILQEDAPHQKTVRNIIFK